MRNTLFAILIAIGTTVFAQTPTRSTSPTDRDTLITTEQWQSILAKAPPGLVSSQLFPGGANCAFIRLLEPDLPHVHAVNSLVVVLEGSATLETGGTLIGPFANGGVHRRPGQPELAAQPPDQPIGPDHHGTAIEGGRTQELKAGDVVLVPAAVPHHWSKVHQQIVYLDIKFPAPESKGN